MHRYDEHGGFYDHVRPPKAPRPDDTPSYPDKNYKFDTLGVRIPTLLISPWIKVI
jgi:phospholipase C